MRRKLGQVLARSALLASIALVGCSRLCAGEIITFGRNETHWNVRLGVTSIRMGCSAEPSACVAAARKMAKEQSVKRIYLAVHLTPSIIDEMKTYSDSLPNAPIVAEIGFDDFPRQYCAFRPWRTLVPVMADSVGA